MSVEPKLISHENIDLKSVTTVSHRQVRKLRRIMSKSYRILLEVSDVTETNVEVITLRTMVGHSAVQSNVVETMIELPSMSPQTHLYPTLPGRRGSLQ